MTADELLATPHRDEHGNDCRLELIRGELRRKPLNNALHGILCAELCAVLKNFDAGKRSGLFYGAGTGFVVEKNPDTVLSADAAFIRRERLADIEDHEKFAPFAPDLAVEVIDTEDTVFEIDDKIALFFGAGSRTVWVIKPERRAVSVYTSPSEVQILGEQDRLEGGDVLPGFSYELAKLFAAVQ